MTAYFTDVSYGLIWPTTDITIVHIIIQYTLPGLVDFSCRAIYSVAS